jgi:hypothetical protein
MNRRRFIKTTVVSVFGLGVLSSTAEADGYGTNDSESTDGSSGEYCYTCEEIESIKRDVALNPRMMGELEADGTIGELRYYCSHQQFHSFEDNCKFDPIREYIEDGWMWDLDIEQNERWLNLDVDVYPPAEEIETTVAVSSVEEQ